MTEIKKPIELEVHRTYILNKKKVAETLGLTGNIEAISFMNIKTDGELKFHTVENLKNA